MPAFTLYGARGSTNTDRVRLTLAEGGFTDYELVILNLQKGEQKVNDLFSFLLETDAASLLIHQTFVPLLMPLHLVQRKHKPSPVG